MLLDEITIVTIHSERDMNVCIYWTCITELQVSLMHHVHDKIEVNVMLFTCWWTGVKGQVEVEGGSAH